ncbi:MAG: twin-arginine translocase subunit TatB [Deltaproteobacteria bacterium]|nr:twin-arginine translocase subunit TatB [Deltaproteobacteria bacterium]
MLGIGWTEFILVALVLLIFVGPKHLPGMLRKFGQVVGELRSASRELRDQIDQEVQDIGSPSKIVRDVGRDLIDDLPSPYAEARRVEQAVKREVNEVAKAVTETPPGPAENKTEIDKEEKEKKEPDPDEEAK